MACSICDIPARREFVNTRLAQGYSFNRVETASKTQEAKDLGVTPVKLETVQRHATKCLVAQVTVTGSASKAKIVVAAPAPSPAAMAQAAARVAVGTTQSGDLAILVRDRVREKLENDEIRLTAQHGLMAQQMLDKREERQKDRELQVALAALLNRAQPTAAALRQVQPRNVTPPPVPVLSRRP